MKTGSNLPCARQRVGEAEQAFARDEVDLVQREDRLTLAPGQALDDLPRVAIGAAGASTSSTISSASPAPDQAAATIARSSRRRGAKMPGVSTKMICVWPSIAMPMRRLRVVCALGVTIASLLPDEAVEQGRLAGIRRPDQRDEPAAGRRQPA